MATLFTGRLECASFSTTGHHRTMASSGCHLTILLPTISRSMFGRISTKEDGGKFFRYISHGKWDGETAGGRPNKGRCGQNPQFLLRTSPTKVFLLLSKVILSRAIRRSTPSRFMLSTMAEACRIALRRPGGWGQWKLYRLSNGLCRAHSG